MLHDLFVTVEKEWMDDWMNLVSDMYFDTDPEGQTLFFVTLQKRQPATRRSSNSEIHGKNLEFYLSLFRFTYLNINSFS